jgi:LysR family transcriptional regulator for bpeEF and oprC
MDRLQQIEVFRRVVETGNITRAARDLSMSQPNVSRIVAELEQRLGVALLLRSPRGLATTEAGQVFYAEAVRVVDALEEAEASARGSQAALHGPLRVACTATLFNSIVMPWLPDFLTEHPGITMEALLDARISELIEEGIDLAIRVGPVSDQSLIARRLGQIELALFASPDYLRRHGAPQRPEGLEEHAICAPSKSRQPVPLRLEGPEDAVCEMTIVPRFRATDVEAVRHATESGFGIGLLPVATAATAVRAGRLAEVLQGWRTEPHDVHAIWPASRALPRRVRAFLDRLVRYSAAEPALRAR